jgi:hypothetical protein
LPEMKYWPTAASDLPGVASFALALVLECRRLGVNDRHPFFDLLRGDLGPRLLVLQIIVIAPGQAHMAHRVVPESER